MLLEYDTIVITNCNRNECGRTDGYGITWYLTSSQKQKELSEESVPNEQELTVKVTGSTNHEHCVTICSAVPITYDADPHRTPYGNKMKIKMPISVGTGCAASSGEISNPLVKSETKKFDFYYELPHNFSPLSAKASIDDQNTDTWQITFVICNKNDPSFMLKGKV